MKRFTLFLAPLMAISFLTNCGPKLYTVTFNTGEGGSLVPSQKVEANKCATKPDDPTKTKEGYTCSFLHWELDNKEFNFNETIDKDITLTAKWKEDINIYTVTFDSNGGSEVDSQEVMYNECAVEPDVPTKEKEGYTCSFLYWELDGARFSFDMPITKDTTLVAKWKEEVNIYTVTFDVDGDKETVEPQYIAYGNRATQPISPTKEIEDLIYEVDYWELDGDKFNFNTPITEDVVLKAKWNEDGMIKASWEELATTKKETYHVGNYKYVTVNNQPHKVRIIGTKHDNIVDESGQVTGEKANYTFEFANLLSDKDGYSLATIWQYSGRKEGYPYPNYFESDLRKAVDGHGIAKLAWYEKGDTKSSTTYTTSALGMLPNELTPYLKMVQKNVRIYDDSEHQHFNSYNAKLFLLTHDEMTTNTISGGNEGTIYQYYNDDSTNSTRVKHQVKWHNGATDSPSKTDDKFLYSYDNYAGYNDFLDDNGGKYWLVSPDVENWSRVWYVNANGELKIERNSLLNYIFPIAPAFCI